MTSISADRIAQIEARRDELQNAMSAPNLAAEQFVKLSRDYAEIEPVAVAAREVRRLREEAEALQLMAGDADPELRQMAGEEMAAMRRRSSRATCSACTSATPKRRAGGWS
jgi:peptide chain release factor 1